MASSLEHLGTDHVDSYVLHGPASGRGWTDDDAEVWAAMVRERDAGRTRLLGVSNVSLRSSSRWRSPAPSRPRSCRTAASRAAAGTATSARSAAERGIVYQGFSLLTANPEVLRHRAGRRHRRARAGDAGPGRVPLRAARSGCCRSPAPPTPSTCAQDLASLALTLSPDEVRGDRVAGRLRERWVYRPAVVGSK